MTATRRRAARSRVLVPALLAVALALVLTPRPASAQPEPPALSDTVNDFAHVINSSSRAELDRRIRALQQTTGDVIVVATVPTYQPYGDINEYAVKMFENQGRGIGDKGKDNGLLIVVAVNDHRIKIETGYDMEGLVPDGFAGETIREYITPEFRRGDYGAGLVAGVTRLINRIAEGRGVTVPDVPQAKPRRARGNDHLRRPADHFSQPRKPAAPAPVLGRRAVERVERRDRAVRRRRVRRRLRRVRGRRRPRRRRVRRIWRVWRRPVGGRRRVGGVVGVDGCSWLIGYLVNW
jgi:uncharacterized protein